MNNYLSYIGLGLTGYFLGFKFVFLCHAIYKALQVGTSASFYQLYIMFLLNSYGLFGSLYIFTLIGLYNLLANFNIYLNYYQNAKSEYANFMKYYDDEVVKDPTKKSRIIETFKKVPVLYYDLSLHYDTLKLRIYDSSYYNKVTNLWSNSTPYTEYVNQKIENLFMILKTYLSTKINMEYYSKMIEEYTKLQEPKPISLAPPPLDSSNMDLPSFMNNMNLSDLTQMEQMVKNMPQLPKLSNPQVYPDLETLMKSMPQQMPSIEDIQKMNTMMELFDNIEKTGLKTRKRKVPNKPSLKK